MEPPYSVWADLLNKFHTAPTAIQALWLVVGWLTVRHVASVIGHVLLEVVRVIDRRGERRRAISAPSGPEQALIKRGDVRALAQADPARLPP
ncbi:hypothetical protein LJD17_02780 [Microvirga rosea]|nr:hypothetical protein [Microvirga rosea]